jgi:hypothetical protein
MTTNSMSIMSGPANDPFSLIIQKWDYCEDIKLGFPTNISLANLQLWSIFV